MGDSLSASSIDRDPQRLWTLDFVLTMLTAHFLFASYTSLFTIVPPYVLAKGGQEWQLGIIVGSLGVVGLLIRPFAGRWTGVVGAKQVAVLGTAIFAITSLLYIPALNVWLLIPVRMLQGAGLAIAPVATSTMIANLAPGHRRAEAMSYMGNSIAISYVYAPVIGFWLLTQFGFEASFLFSAASGALGVALALGISASRTHVPISGTLAQKIPLISQRALFPTAVFLTYTLTTAPVNTFLPILAQQRDLGNPGLYFTVNSLTTMFAMLLAGPIADRVGRPAVIVPGLISTAAGMFLLTAASMQLMFLGAGFLVGAGFGMLQPGIQSLTVDRVPTRERSAGMATLQQAWDIGGSGGSFVLGPVGGVIGIAATFAIVGVGALAGALGFIVGNARKPAALPDG